MDLIQIKSKELLPTQTAEMLVEIEKTIKALKEKEDEIKANLLSEMEKHGVLKIESDIVSVSYIAETDRESFDAKTFRADHPDLYDHYVRMSPVKAQIRVKVK